MLKRLGEEAGLNLMHLGAWGSEKYMVAAVLGRWLTAKELRPGIRSRFDLVFPWLALQDGRKNACSPQVVTDTWALYRKPCLNP